MQVRSDQVALRHRGGTQDPFNHLKRSAMHKSCATGQPAQLTYNEGNYHPQYMLSAALSTRTHSFSRSADANSHCSERNWK
jgi:hypothetical protein